MLSSCPGYACVAPGGGGACVSGMLRGCVVSGFTAMLVVLAALATACFAVEVACREGGAKWRKAMPAVCLWVIAFLSRLVDTL